jgi:hypothetical protein
VLRGAFPQPFGCGTLPSGIALFGGCSCLIQDGPLGGNPTPQDGEPLAAERSPHATSWEEVHHKK